MNPQAGRRKDILRAALMGVALGRPVTNLKEGHVRQAWGGPPEGFHPTGVLFPDRPGRNTLPGLHGAAGQELLAAVLASQPEGLGRTPVAFTGAALLELSGGTEGEDDGEVRAPGRPLLKAIRRWRANYPWEEVDWYAEDEPSEGLGPALRGIVPVLMGWEEPVPWAGRLARLTHGRLLPQSAAMVAALALRELLGSGPKRKPGDIAASIREELEPLEDALREEQGGTWREFGWSARPRGLAEALAPLPSLLREGREDLALSTILQTARQYEPQHQVGHVQHGFPPAGIAWVLFVALGGTAPRLAMEALLARGGEAEVLGGLLAALCVARHGAECFPEEWYAGTLGLGALEEAAEGQLSTEAWVAREGEWNREEEAMRAPLQEAVDKKREAAAAKKKTSGKKPPAAGLVEQAEANFAPPPHLWLEPEDAEDPRKKKILKAARGKKKIGWKEERKRKRER